MHVQVNKKGKFNKFTVFNGKNNHYNGITYIVTELFYIHVSKNLKQMSNTLILTDILNNNGSRPTVYSKPTMIQFSIRYEALSKEKPFICMKQNSQSDVIAQN